MKWVPQGLLLSSGDPQPFNSMKIIKCRQDATGYTFMRSAHLQIGRTGQRVPYKHWSFMMRKRCACCSLRLFIPMTYTDRIIEDACAVRPMVGPISSLCFSFIAQNNPWLCACAEGRRGSSMHHNNKSVGWNYPFAHCGVYDMNPSFQRAWRQSRTFLVTSCPVWRLSGRMLTTAISAIHKGGHLRKSSSCSSWPIYKQRSTFFG